MARRKTTQSYTEEFKRGVVAQLRAVDAHGSPLYPRTQIAEAHRVSMGTLRNWEAKFANDTNLPQAQPLQSSHQQTQTQAQVANPVQQRGRISQSRAPMAARRSGTTQGRVGLSQINQQIEQARTKLGNLLLQREMISHQ